MVIKILLFSSLAAILVVLGLLIVLSADDQGAPSKEQLFSFRDAGCTSCHTPVRSQGSDPHPNGDSTLISVF